MKKNLNFSKLRACHLNLKEPYLPQSGEKLAAHTCVRFHDVTAPKCENPYFNLIKRTSLAYKVMLTVCMNSKCKVATTTYKVYELYSSCICHVFQ